MFNYTDIFVGTVLGPVWKKNLRTTDLDLTIKSYQTKNNNLSWHLITNICHMKFTSSTVKGMADIFEDKPSRSLPKDVCVVYPKIIKYQLLYIH